MLYLKIMDGEEIVSAEAQENPVYIRRQVKNNIRVRCPEPLAQGVLSLDGSTAYQLDGKESMGLEDALMAYPIAMTEYEEIIADLHPDEDPEDEEPEIPEGEDEEEVLTRAELTKRVNIIEECILEMSEMVYGGEEDE